MEILPFYIISFSGLYLYFSISSIVDIKGRTRVLKVNIIDYLENHMVSRLSMPELDLSLQEDKPSEKEKNVFSKKDERELEELLREFLA